MNLAITLFAVAFLLFYMNNHIPHHIDMHESVCCAVCWKNTSLSFQLLLGYDSLLCLTKIKLSWTEMYKDDVGLVWWKKRISCGHDSGVSWQRIQLPIKCISGPKRSVSSIFSFTSKNILIASPRQVSHGIFRLNCAVSIVQKSARLVKFILLGGRERRQFWMSGARQSFEVW